MNIFKINNMCSIIQIHCESKFDDKEYQNQLELRIYDPWYQQTSKRQIPHDHLYKLLVAGDHGIG